MNGCTTVFSEADLKQGNSLIKNTHEIVQVFFYLKVLENIALHSIMCTV